jgi:prephenate dehydrogenase
MGREALIAGLGLIGGSIGMALRGRGWRVRYVDPHVAFEDAQRSGAADAREDALGDADVIVLATPVDVAVEQLGLLPDVRGVVTSVCSVMQPLRVAAQRRFVAGHPLAGSEQRGLSAANGELFAGRRWFVDADEATVNNVIADCGAVREQVDAAEHDHAVALTSHLPQVLSTALAAYLADRDLLRFGGTGLQTFLRLAGSDASVWAPILEANRANLTPHVEPLLALVREIVDGDAGAFAKANDMARALERK